MDRKEKIYNYILLPDYIPLTESELCSMLDVPKKDRMLFHDIIDALLSEGKIVKNKKGRIKKSSAPIVRGKFHITKSGYAYVSAIGETSDVGDIYIKKDDTKFALEGDIVSVKITHKKDENHKHTEGIVTSIISRCENELIGTVVKKGSSLFFVPDLISDMYAFISADSLAVNDTKATAKILVYPDETHSMIVRITETIGKSSDAHTLADCILRENNINEKFSQKALEEAKDAPQSLSDEDIYERADFRSDKVITIDGEDARDLDDAVCVKRNKDGYTLYVHIADVSHYVPSRSALDKDAFLRGTSVYIPDRVIPMLPRELSNGICSLNEGETRLTLSVTMHIDKNGDVYDYKIEKGVICSLHRMTYSDTQKILDGDKGMSEKYSDIKDDLFVMMQLAKILKSKRRACGEIDFDFPEPKITLDDKGEVLALQMYKTGMANEIIEQFMLLANETVAKHAVLHNFPFVYRVHEAPSAEKTESLKNYLNLFSVPNNIGQNKTQSADIQKILLAVKGTPIESIVSDLCLRSMMKARYSPENLGHFGLASKYYCHFTSPIRRYPDLAIHRILSEEITRGAFSENMKSRLSGFVSSAAEQSSECEIKAVCAEREADKMYECIYMQKFIGEEFDGIITSVTDFGIFVSVLECIEGLVSISQLCDDYYIYEQNLLRLKGEQSGKTFELGQSVRVKLVNANPQERQIDFEIVGMEKRIYMHNRHSNSTNNKKKIKSKQKKKFKKFISKKNKKRK